MQKSIFLKIEGFTPKNKVLDFLITAQDFDYSLKDIAEFSEISYPCMKQLKKELIRDKWIFLTRKIGKAQMYKLNLKSKKVQKFIEFYWSVINEEVEKQLDIKNIKQEEKIHSSQRLGMPVSARGI